MTDKDLTYLEFTEVVGNAYGWPRRAVVKGRLPSQAIKDWASLVAEGSDLNALKVVKLRYVEYELGYKPVTIEIIDPKFYSIVIPPDATKAIKFVQRYD